MFATVYDRLLFKYHFYNYFYPQLILEPSQTKIEKMPFKILILTFNLGGNKQP